MEMTNEQKAQRLEAIAAKLPQSEELPPRFWGDQVIAMTEEHPDVSLLRESAALMRERDWVRWLPMRFGGFIAGIGAYTCLAFPSIKKPDRWVLYAWEPKHGTHSEDTYHPTLDAAKAAAIAWVDAQEGK